MFTRRGFVNVCALVAIALAGAAAGATQRQGGPGADVSISGELRQWHKVTLTLTGPQADELSNAPNPFMDYRLTVTFAHESGSPTYRVPGYFAGDGNAANSSATSGNKWRAHLAPDKTGRWTYRISFVSGKGVALAAASAGQTVAPFDGRTGTIQVAATDKRAPDFRARGRLQYTGRHYLQFAGSGEYFLKLGADSPETLLAYADFDGTVARKPQVPLHTFAPHVQDWRAGDPTWKGDKGKGLIGAINYLASKGVNSISFLPYNAGGDGDNVWPFVAPRRQVPLRRLEARPVADRVRSRAAEGHLSALQAAGKRDRRQRARKSRRAGARQAADRSRRASAGVARRRRPRAGAQALRTRARRTIRLRARAELEHRGREHAVERAAAGDGDESQGHRSIRRPSHRHPHISERAGKVYPSLLGKPVALYRRVAADGVERRARTDAAMGARVVAGEETVGRGQRRAGAGGPGRASRSRLRGFRRKGCARAPTSDTRSTTFARTRCGAI